MPIGNFDTQNSLKITLKTRNNFYSSPSICIYSIVYHIYIEILQPIFTKKSIAWHRKCKGKERVIFMFNHFKIVDVMNIKPLADRVLIQPAAAEDKTAGGIIIPDSAKEKPLKGSVVAVGKGTKDEEMVVKVGDQVLYGKYAGTELELDNEKYIIMRQSDILAII